MKQYNSIRLCQLLLLLIVTIALCACVQKPYPHSLYIADSLASVQPDSALHLLKEIENNMTNEPEVTQMYYRLLLIKAQDKAYVAHTSDSNIVEIVRYYEKKRNKRHLAEAYYYAGRVYSDLRDSPQALDYFQKALEQAAREGNTSLSNIIYSQTGNLYLYQNISDKALQVFKEALQYAQANHDSISQIYDLRDIGRAYSGLQCADSAIYYYEKALKTARNIHHSYLTGIISQEISELYAQLGKREQAWDALKASLHTLHTYPAPYYATLADLYYKDGILDSAQYYSHKNLRAGTNFYHKQEACKILKSIAYRQGNYRQALAYAEKQIAYTDSIQQTVNQEAVQKVNALYNYKLREKENVRLKEMASKQKRLIGIFVATTAILGTLLTAIYIIRKLKQGQAHNRLITLAKEQYRNSLKQIADNENHIQELEQRLKETAMRKDEMAIQIQQAQKELLEKENLAIETRQKVKELSEKVLIASTIYRDFHHVGHSPHSESWSTKTKITENDWKELIAKVNETYDNFTLRLTEFYPDITEQELRVSILLKIGIKPTGIGEIIAKSKQSITSIRKKLYKRTHNEEGGSEDWDNFIRQF